MDFVWIRDPQRPTGSVPDGYDRAPPIQAFAAAFRGLARQCRGFLLEARSEEMDERAVVFWAIRCRPME
jgi:hypothetical protein